jgi:hypothetical protein
VPPLVYLWDPGEVDPPAVRRPRKILRNLRNLDIVVAFSSRRASPHYYGIITSYKSSTAFSPQYTVPPTTTTTPASSSDLCPRNHVNVPRSSAKLCYSVCINGSRRILVWASLRVFGARQPTFHDHPCSPSCILDPLYASSVSKLSITLLMVVVVQSRLLILGIHATAHRLFSASILVPPLFFAHSYSSLFASCCG